MLEVLREYSFLSIGRNRATRSAEKFSRPFGAPFFIAPAKARNSATRIPISWGEECVTFSVSPIVGRKVDGRVSGP